MTGTSSEQYSSVHDLTVKDIRGNDVDLSIYKGKVLLIVNVASQCGLTTSNYTELNEDHFGLTFLHFSTSLLQLSYISSLVLINVRVETGNGKMRRRAYRVLVGSHNGNAV